MRAPEPLETLLKRLSVDKSDNILSALKKMDQLGIKLLIVNDNGSFKSLLSIGDIQRAIVRGVKLQEKIGGILREKVTVCYEYQSEEDIRQSMIHHRAEFMPVLNEEKGISRIVFWNDIIQDRSIHEMSGIDLPVVIMAGGRGTRLKPLTNIIPKPLIPIGEKSIIEMIFDSFKKFGMREFHLIVNYKAAMIENYISEIEDRDYHVNIVKEDAEYGTGGSLSMLKGVIDRTFFMTNCDTLLDQDFSEVYNFHKENNNELTIIGALKHYDIPYGKLEFHNGGQLLEITEKPELTLTVNSGTYILEPHLLNEIPEKEFFHITELITKISKRNGNVGVFPVSEMSWLDIGEWKEFKKTQDFLANRQHNLG